MDEYSKFTKGNPGYQIFNLQGIALPMTPQSTADASPEVYNVVRILEKRKNLTPILFTNFTKELSAGYAFDCTSFGTLCYTTDMSVKPRMIIDGIVYSIAESGQIKNETLPTAAPTKATKAPAQAETPVKATIEGGKQ